jgi:hypothetical protein
VSDHGQAAGNGELRPLLEQILERLDALPAQLAPRGLYDLDVAFQRHVRRGSEHGAGVIH